MSDDDAGLAARVVVVVVVVVVVGVLVSGVARVIVVGVVVGGRVLGHELLELLVVGLEAARHRVGARVKVGLQRLELTRQYVLEGLHLGELLVEAEAALVRARRGHAQAGRRVERHHGAVAAQTRLAAEARLAAMLVDGLEPLVALLDRLGAQVPDAVVDAYVEAAVVELVRRDRRLAERDGAAAPVACLALALVVAEYALLEHNVALLPAVYVVGPLVQVARQLVRLELERRVGQRRRRRRVARARAADAATATTVGCARVGRLTVLLAAQLAVLVVRYVYAHRFHGRHFSF